MARPDPERRLPPLRLLAFAGAVALGAITCSTAQEAPPPPPPAQEPPKEPAKEPTKPVQDAAPKDAPPPAHERKLHVKKCTVPGAVFRTGELFPRGGRRTAGARVRLAADTPSRSGSVSRQSRSRRGADPANPGQTHAVEHGGRGRPVSIAEIDGSSRPRAVGAVGNGDVRQLAARGRPRAARRRPLLLRRPARHEGQLQQAVENRQGRPVREGHQAEQRGRPGER